MKQILTITLLLFLISCAGSKKAVYSPVGTWNYEVTGTPNGDAQGVMTITQTEEGLAGTFKSPQYGDAKMENLAYVSESKTISCTLYLAGLDLMLDGTFEAEAFTGTIDAGQAGAFPMTATRNISN